MPKPTTAASSALNMVIVTLDNHLSTTLERALADLQRQLPGLQVVLHAAAHWTDDQPALQRCIRDIGQADIIVATMLFMEEQIQPVLPALRARRDHCDAMICLLAAPEVCQLTRMGSLDMSKPQGAGMAWLKKLRGRSADAEGKAPSGNGEKQMAMLRRLPQLLRFIPGTAQDLRIYFLTMQYWLLGSDINIANMVRLLAARYSTERIGSALNAKKVPPPVQYPDTGLYHPALEQSIATSTAALPRMRKPRGRVGLIVMRSYVLAGNTKHYDGVIAAFEALKIAVVPVFASGLDCRPAIQEFLVKDGVCQVDALVSLTGFSLVGGPAYNDSEAATELLKQLNVPYISALALEFQSIDQWRASERGLLPLETMMMVAIPELDGATGTMVYGGRDDAMGPDLQCDPERAGALAARVAAMVGLRKQDKAERKLAVVLYDFPPNSGSTGSAAYLSVFRSLHNVLQALADDGYDVEVPATVAELQARVLEGNASTFGTAANVCARVTTDRHVEREPHLAEIEAQWGAAPGRLQTDGQSLLVLGEQFGSVFVGVQPAFGYEGDPMKLMFQQGLAPTHAFSAFYQYIRHDFAADALLHFGMHGAMEFMPGKQVGMSADCWPERLAGHLPHLYLYAANNPSEAALAKRRANATTISYITPMVAKAGLYKDLQTLKDLLERLRQEPVGNPRTELVCEVRTLAETLELHTPESEIWNDEEQAVVALSASLVEMENALIPHGLHVLGETPPDDAIEQLLEASATAAGTTLAPALLTQIAAGASLQTLQADGQPLCESQRAVVEPLLALRAGLTENAEIPALLRALDGQFIAPVAGGDLIRNSDILPTGRNVHGFDPTRLPSRHAIAEGARQAQTLLDSARVSAGLLPRRLAMVLWGTDNLKNEGVGIAEAMALLGTRPRFDSYGRLAGAELIPLAELGRPRVDVVVTVSGIFRDLLPRQMQLLAEAAWLCASADEPAADNPIRELALRCADALDLPLETAALRVFGNDESAYGANVNQMVDNGMWQSEEELGAMFMQRRCFAYGQSGVPTPQAQLLEQLLAEVDITFQNLDSLELGITTLDHYVDSLGGISRAVENARGTSVPTLVGDYTQGEGAVRTLTDQVALEGRTRMLNPSWYESMLEHGFEGVHQIEAHFTNMLGWSATTAQVDPWIYSELSKTYLLDTAMRERLAALNPLASVKMAQRMLEANERNYWSPDADTLEALREAGDALEDQLEGVSDSLGAPAEAFA